MSDKTKIEWSDSTWTPIRAKVRDDAAEIAKVKGYTSLVQIAAKQAGKVGAQCERCSPGCDNCYSETFQSRCLPHNGTGLPFDRRSRDLVEYFLYEEVLLQPLKWRKPRKVFVCSQTDLFGDWVPDEWIDRIFAVMALCPHITFQVLTKRAERMERYLKDEFLAVRVDAFAWELLEQTVDPLNHMSKDARALAQDMEDGPLSNVHLGVSVENQEQRKRIEHLRRTSAAVRFLSVEPLLEDLGTLELSGIHWTIIGGESGPGARPCDLEWICGIVRQCKAAGTKCFVKQWGSVPVITVCRQDHYEWGEQNHPELWRVHLKHKKGGDPSEWPEDIRVREFPEIAMGAVKMIINYKEQAHSRCFRCDGHGFICDICGESEVACKCEEPTFSDCSDCGGTGK